MAPVLLRSSVAVSHIDRDSCNFFQFLLLLLRNCSANPSFFFLYLIPAQKFSYCSPPRQLSLYFHSSEPLINLDKHWHAVSGRLLSKQKAPNPLTHVSSVELRHTMRKMAIIVSAINKGRTVYVRIEGTFMASNLSMPTLLAHSTYKRYLSSGFRER